MSLLAAYTLLHVAISLVAIGSGFVVIAGLLAAKPLERLDDALPGDHGRDKSDRIRVSVPWIHAGPCSGVISLVVLAVTIYARYPRHLTGGWRRIYVIGATTALYLNVFVLIVQSFQKVPALKALAPTQSEASCPGTVDRTPGLFGPGISPRSAFASQRLDLRDESEGIKWTSRLQVRRRPEHGEVMERMMAST